MLRKLSLIVWIASVYGEGRLKGGWMQLSNPDSETVEERMQTRSCPSQETTFIIKVKTDNYPDETSWSLTNTCLNQIVLQNCQLYHAENKEHYQSFCIKKGQRYSFTIEDNYGDGICCGQGNGSYTIEYDGSVIKTGGVFLENETNEFGTCSVTQASDELWDTVKEHYNANISEFGEGKNRDNRDRFDDEKLEPFTTEKFYSPSKAMLQSWNNYFRIFWNSIYTDSPTTSPTTSPLAVESLSASPSQSIGSVESRRWGSGDRKDNRNGFDDKMLESIISEKLLWGNDYTDYHTTFQSETDLLNESP